MLRRYRPGRPLNSSVPTVSAAIIISPTIASSGIIARPASAFERAMSLPVRGIKGRNCRADRPARPHNGLGRDVGPRCWAVAEVSQSSSSMYIPPMARSVLLRRSSSTHSA
jgi:hypothetical protein